jgi:uncharacterized membrane protein
VDEAAAVAAARDAGVVIRLTVRIGDAVVTGTPMALAWAVGPQAVDAEAVADALDDGVRLDYERSATRDVAYGLRKIIDISVRVLSPGTNDPTTAVHALSHASAVLGELGVRPAGDRRIRDEDGAVRVVVPGWELAALVDLVVEEPLQFAEGQPAVLRRNTCRRTSATSTAPAAETTQPMAQLPAARRYSHRPGAALMPCATVLATTTRLPAAHNRGSTTPSSSLNIR